MGMSGSGPGVDEGAAVLVAADGARGYCRLAAPEVALPATLLAEDAAAEVAFEEEAPIMTGVLLVGEREGVLL